MNFVVYYYICVVECEKRSNVGNEKKCDFSIYVMRIIIVCTSKNYKLFARSIIQQWSSKDRAATYYYSSKR